MVKAGKARYIGISNCFAWQLAKANALAEKEGFTKFVSIQGHYNLIFREEEREMAKLCAEDNVAMTPYSALAGGRLSKTPGETSKRLEEDSYAKFKYDATAKQDGVVIGRVQELAEKHGVSMTEASLAWLLTKVTAPVVGATKLYHIEGAAKAVDLVLSEEERLYLEDVPAETFGRLFGEHKGFGVLMAATVGVPLYACGGGTIPLLQQWLASGMSMGSASAFMITGPATKITNLGALKIVLGVRRFVLYLAFVILFSLAAGLLIDLML